MTLALAFVVGFLAGRVAWLLLRPVLGQPVFARENYRGVLVPTGAGLVVAVATAGVEAARTVVAVATSDPSRHSEVRAGVLVLVTGMGLLGLVDDIAGGADRRGFRGHLSALATGRLTTGALKLVGGAGVAAVAVAIARPDDNLAWLLADAALVALAANLANLFDRAPGRAIKFGALAAAALVAATAVSPRLASVVVVVGATLAILVDDLHERVMLGDTGANLLGATVGLGVVVAATPSSRLVALAVVAILNGVSEWVSFSRVIDAVAPLRAFDRAGRRA